MQNNKMGVMPIKRLIITMSLPIIFSMLIQALYNVVDSVFVAQINDDALTALSLAFPLQLVVIAGFVGLGIGINSLISRKLGEGDEKTAVLAAEHGILLGLSLYAIVAILGFVLSKPFYGLFTENQQVIEYGVTYTRIVMGVAFGRILAQAGMSIFQGTGEMVKPMIAQLIGAVINIILDPILIFGWFGLPAMGVAGAATATVIAQSISMIYVWAMLLGGKSSLKLNMRNFKARLDIVKQIIAVGLPAAVNQGLAAIMLTALNLILSAYGESAIAVMGAYYKIQSMVFMPIFGLSTGTMPVLGYNFGAKDKKRFYESVHFSVLLAIGFMAFCMVIFQVFPKGILTMYNATDEMMFMGIPAFRTISLMFPAVGATIILLMVFPAIGKAYYSLIVNVIRQFVLLLPSAYILGELAGINGIWFAFLITEFIGVGLSVLLYRKITGKIQWNS